MSAVTLLHECWKMHIGSTGLAACSRLPLAFISAALPWGCFMLVWDCCSALVCCLMSGTARWLSSPQHNTGPIHSAHQQQCWALLGEAQERAEAGQTQYSSMPMTCPCAVSVMWHWGLAWLCHFTQLGWGQDLPNYRHVCKRPINPLEL